MPDLVPTDDEIVVLFSFDFEWDETLQKPHREIFEARAHKLSSWHTARLERQGSRRDVCIDKFDGHWEAILTPAKCRVAGEAVLDGKSRPKPIKVGVEFDPGDAVGLWVTYADAHTSIFTEATSGTSHKFPPTLQGALRDGCVVVNPEGQMVPPAP